MTDALIIQILSMMFCAMGLGIFVNPRFYKKIMEDFVENESISFLTSLASFTIGFLLISLRRAPYPEHVSIITIMGWIALLKGLLMITLPKPLLQIVKIFAKKQGIFMFCGTILLLIGIVFMYMGVKML
jgi:uncharacterized protein YjeT (DUF2065 family)